VKLRRWKVWRIDRGEGHEVWQGCEGPATNPPADHDLSGMDWVEAATVDVVELPAGDAVEVSVVAYVLHRDLDLEDPETGLPAPREHYIEVARSVVAALSAEPVVGEGR